MLALRAAVEVHAFAHITGGGIAGNLGRVLPGECDAVVQRGSWTEPRIFDEIRTLGAVPEDEMARVFNLGIGMIAVVPPGALDGALATLAPSLAAHHIGEITAGTGQVTLQ
jgi:phosphoribosylformylglycinamidine cyclo-ligase